MIELRREAPGDIAAVRDLNRRAFGQDQEGNIVDALRANDGVLLSLVAVDDGRVVGHILFSPVRVGAIEGAALGPMAVLPDVQRRGIGTKLVQAGADQLARFGCPLIVVVGHPDYYLRFGFRPAAAYGISCQWDVPEEAFMGLWLDDTHLSGAVGAAEYRHEFHTVV